MVWAPCDWPEPVAAAPINPGSAIVAEMNGFRPLLGPPGWDQLKARRAVAARPGEARHPSGPPADDPPPAPAPGVSQKTRAGRRWVGEACGDESMCNYNFDLPVEPEAAHGAASLRMIEENGGTVTGAPFRPSPSPSPPALGRVEGRCKLVKDRLVNIQVTKKPDFMTCQMVREKLIFILSEAVKKISSEP